MWIQVSSEGVVAVGFFLLVEVGVSARGDETGYVRVREKELMSTKVNGKRRVERVRKE